MSRRHLERSEAFILDSEAWLRSCAAVAVLAAVTGWGAAATAQTDGLITTRVAGIKLKLIPAGEFLMGSSKGVERPAFDNELPKHRVRITRPFYLGVTEVTQGQYRAVTGQSPSFWIGSDDLPVEQIGWFDAVNFCNALSRAADRRPGVSARTSLGPCVSWRVREQ